MTELKLFAGLFAFFIVIILGMLVDNVLQNLSQERIIVECLKQNPNNALVCNNLTIK